jgi:hypothetical protein
MKCVLAVFIVTFAVLSSSSGAPLAAQTREDWRRRVWVDSQAHLEARVKEGFFFPSIFYPSPRGTDSRALHSDQVLILQEESACALRGRRSCPASSVAAHRGPGT